jgi:hypothetical protein
MSCDLAQHLDPTGFVHDFVTFEARIIWCF